MFLDGFGRVWEDLSVWEGLEPVLTHVGFLTPLLHLLLIIIIIIIIILLLIVIIIIILIISIGFVIERFKECGKATVGAQ